jgi:spermidine synthase
MLSNENWFTEIYDASTAFSFRYHSKIYDTRSEFQRIEVYDSVSLGRVLILGGCFMVCNDSFIYHEMMVHPAMSVSSRVQDVAVIGGGDGGIVTELVKYPEIESIVLCEIDPEVVRIGREFFPEISSGLDDDRVKVVNEDGAYFLQRAVGVYDLVIVDSTDPVGPGASLFTEEFFVTVKNSLAEYGAAVFQTESPLFMPGIFGATVKSLSNVFSYTAQPMFFPTPSYPSGYWTATICSEEADPYYLMERKLPEGLKYYTKDVHKAALAVPVFVEDLLRTK